jgi:hypothetical protein
MDSGNISDQVSNQFSEVQKIFFNTWGTMISNVHTINIMNSHENVEETVQLQEELIKNSLELQEQVTRLTIETPRKIWNSYFQMLRRL